MKAQKIKLKKGVLQKEAVRQFADALMLTRRSLANKALPETLGSKESLPGSEEAADRLPSAPVVSTAAQANSRPGNGTKRASSSRSGSSIPSMSELFATPEKARHHPSEDAANPASSPLLANGDDFEAGDIHLSPIAAAFLQENISELVDRPSSSLQANFLESPMLTGSKRKAEDLPHVDSAEKHGKHQVAASGAGSAGPPTKMSRSSAMARCSQLYAPMSSRFPDFTKVMSKEGWAERSTQEAMYRVLEETCRLQQERINNLVPRPRAKAFKLMNNRLQAFFIRSRVLALTYEEPFVHKPPEAAYALEALSEASSNFDKKIGDLERLQNALKDPQEMDVLLERMGIGLPTTSSVDVQKKRSSAELGTQSAQHSSDNLPGVFKALDDTFTALRAKADYLHSLATKSKMLTASISGHKPNKVLEPAQPSEVLTPHGVFARLQSQKTPGFTG